MSITFSMKLYLTCGIIFLSIIGLIIPCTTADIKNDPGDQVWYDSFDTDTTTSPFHCEVKDGEIILEMKENETNDYNFHAQENHEVSGYSSVIFFRFLKNHPKEKPYYFPGDSLKYTSPPYLDCYTEGLFSRCAIQHFRFKVDENKESVNQILLQWYGKREGNTQISFYYWNSSRFHFGYWEKINCLEHPGSEYYGPGTITKSQVKYAIGNDGYIDISVVLTSPFFRKITLSTNYINLKLNSAGYWISSKINATVQTRDPIDLDNISTGNSASFWNFLTWDDYRPEDTNVRYRVLYEKSPNDWPPVDDTIIPGNKNGTDKSPVFLNNLSKKVYNDTYKRLKIQAILNTTDHSETPHIYSWAITWQNETGWRDSFNTSYKIEQQTKMKLENNSLCISLLQDEWPVSGFDSRNTRATNGLGPKTKKDYWYSSEQVGGGFRNPVIGDKKVFILSTDALHIYNVERNSDGEVQYNDSSLSFEDTIFENSPALSEKFIIIASGKQAKGGSLNIVYGLDKYDLSKKWTYEDEEFTCYFASPVIAQNTIYISSWSGDNGTSLLEKRYKNNKLIALDLESGGWRWDYDLPAESFSTPAVNSDYVIVGCLASTKNDSIFAFRIDGKPEKPKWSRSVGSIGHASPVIYEDKVFITCQEVNYKNFTIDVKIRALDLDNGEILWNRTIGTFILSKKIYTDSTPAVFNNILYIASPNGSIYALNTNDGSVRWTEKYYPYFPIIFPQPLTSSPAYADGLIYFGTPQGKIYGIDASNGKERWPTPATYGEGTMVRGSPIVSNNLIFITDETTEAGTKLISIGEFKNTATQGDSSVISQPIRLPEGLTWKSFQGNNNTIDTNHGSITYQLLDENKNILKNNIRDGDDLRTFGTRQSLRLKVNFKTDDISKTNPYIFDWGITFTPKDSTPPTVLSTDTTPIFNGKVPPNSNFSIIVRDEETGLLNNSAKYTLRYTLNSDPTNETYTVSFPAQYFGKNQSTIKETITANLTAIPDFNNIKSLVSIKFTIKDCVHNEVVKIFSYPKDTKSPSFLSTDTAPKFDGKVRANYNITVQDKETGLLIDSAKYLVQYILNNKTLPFNDTAQCNINRTNAINGTKQIVKMIADLTKIPNYEDITSIVSIAFSIMDCAENKATVSVVKDNTKPSFLSTDTAPSFTGKPHSEFSVKVQDTGTGLLTNSARYLLIYVINNKTYHSPLSPLSQALCTGTNGTTAQETITANLSKIENYKNITLLVNITFYITDVAGYEATKTYSADNIKPYIYPSTIPPFDGKPVPKIIIKAIDNKSGSGLLVSSASYTLKYIINNKTLTHNDSAQCTGTNGTTQVQNITANLSKIPSFKNITKLVSIDFSIYDIAGNKGTRLIYPPPPDGDKTAPNSSITNKFIKPWYNATTTYILINATASDSGTNASGVQQVKLYYRDSSTGTFTGDWIYFSNSNKTSPQWKFNFTNNLNKHGGYFELCTIAIDKKNNTEKFPEKGDISFIYDWTKPYKPDFEENILWFKEPSTISVVFEDDFRLNTIQYQPNFTTSTWTTIASNINQSTYSKSWSLKNEYWDQIKEGELYKLYFKINDTVGNTLLLTSDNQAIIFAKDISSPNGTIKIENESSSSYNFTIAANVFDQADGSGIKEVSLYYRFSKDDSNWSNWTQFGDTLKSSPIQWDYTAQEGDGYYELKIKITDIAGNIQESPILYKQISPIQQLPVILILIMISLLIIFAILFVTIFVKYRKRKVE